MDIFSQVVLHKNKKAITGSAVNTVEINFLVVVIANMYWPLTMWQALCKLVYHYYVI